MYSKLFSKDTVHVKPRQIFYGKGCLQSTSVEVTIHSYYKCYNKNGSQTFTANFLMYCTYKVNKNPFNGKAGYYCALLLVLTMHYRLVTTRDKRLSCMLTPNGWSKAEATNLRHI